MSGPMKGRKVFMVILLKNPAKPSPQRPTGSPI